MKILIVGKVNDYQARRLKEEGVKRGHVVDSCYSSELIVRAYPPNFEVTLRDKPLTDYNVIYLCALGRKRWEWYAVAKFLHQKYNTKIFNTNTISSQFLNYRTYALEFWQEIEAQIKIPKTAIISSKNSIDCVLKDFTFPMIVKGSISNQGKGIYLAHSKEEIIEIIKNKKEEFMAYAIREFIPNKGDIRIFTVGYRAVGAMQRVSKTGDFRSNISQGGQGQIFDLNSRPDVREIAEQISRITHTEIAGVDIMLHEKSGEPYLLEINTGPQIEGIEKFTSVNVALEIIRYFEQS